MQSFWFQTNGTVSPKPYVGLDFGETIDQEGLAVVGIAILVEVDPSLEVTMLITARPSEQD